MQTQLVRAASFISDAPVERRYYEWLAFQAESDMRQEARVKNGVNRLGIISATLWQTAYSRAIVQRVGPSIFMESMIQFVSQVLPSSLEKACSQ